MDKMIANIKLVLDIKDDKFDSLINLYVDKLTSNVLGYCCLNQLNPVLESFIEDKVVSIISPKVKGGNQNTGEVKAVSRGDTKIEYNVGSVVSDVTKGALLSQSDMKYLNSFRPTSWRLF